MKTLFSYCFGIFAVFSFSNCANGKKTQEEAPIAFEQAYVQDWETNANSGSKGMSLFIPTGSFDTTAVQLDSVYFKGRRAALKASGMKEQLYVAHFEVERKKDSGFVMSSDPKEEYGNTVPAIGEKFPFDLAADEAVISYIRGNKKGYYKITDVEDRTRDKGPIKKPENVQH